MLAVYEVRTIFGYLPYLLLVDRERRDRPVIDLTKHYGLARSRAYIAGLLWDHRRESIVKRLGYIDGDISIESPGQYVEDAARMFGHVMRYIHSYQRQQAVIQTDALDLAVNALWTNGAMTDSNPPPRRRPGRRPNEGNSSPYARTLSSPNWRPPVPEDQIDRTCLFCSRALAPDQPVCPHCGSRSP